MLSASELELYDRQIRVWGIEAQRRLRQLSICVVSSSLASTGLAFETLKNLCLAGVASVTFIPCPSSHPRPAQVANEDTKEGDITEEVTRATGDSIEEVTRATGDSIEEVTRATGASLESILRGLNPAVRVEVSKRYTSVSALEAAKGIDFWSEFDCVVSVGLDLEEAVRINEGCRKGCRSKGTAFFSAHPFGFQAVVFADLVEYQYVLYV